ncbi:hypothetical protein E2562_012525 [Oryza meyeriana var. granulata]|uniref:Uncharacterized protein n=1 Tax=Oryza meyeriana var. granulata TaxID=110450 RepID=A0A6G1D2P0_9ORYZ|nr:hypothetical protein E2562_012525 [Oryza meyeriana var. granulata]
MTWRGTPATASGRDDPSRGEAADVPDGGPAPVPSRRRHLRRRQRESPAPAAASGGATGGAAPARAAGSWRFPTPR